MVFGVDDYSFSDKEYIFTMSLESPSVSNDAEESVEVLSPDSESEAVGERYRPTPEEVQNVLADPDIRRQLRAFVLTLVRDKRDQVQFDYEDLIQDSLEKALRYSRDFGDVTVSNDRTQEEVLKEAALKSLFKIARHTFYDRLRSGAIRNNVPYEAMGEVTTGRSAEDGDGENAPFIFVDPITPERHVTGYTMFEKLVAYLKGRTDSEGKLPSKFRTLIMKMNGATHDEVAYKLGINEGAAKQQLYKARSELREQFPAE